MRLVIKHFEIFPQNDSALDKTSLILARNHDKYCWFIGATYLKVD